MQLHLVSRAFAIPCAQCSRYREAALVSIENLKCWNT